MERSDHPASGLRANPGLRFAPSRAASVVAETRTADMTFWLLLTVNSVTFGGLLFLLSAGFSLIFGLMRIPNLTHGSMFMVGAYLGATFFVGGALGFTLNFWIAAMLGGARSRGVRRADGAAAAAPACRPAIGAGAGDARRLLHGRRSLPDGLGWRSDLGGDAAGAGRLHPRRHRSGAALSACHHRHRRRVRHRALADARAHPARRHDPRRRRRSADGTRGRHPRVAAVHPRVRAWAPGSPVLPA